MYVQLCLINKFVSIYDLHKCSLEHALCLTYVSVYGLCCRLSFKKDTTNPEIYKQLYLQLISEYPLSEKIFTDGSKTEEGVAAAAVSTKRMKKTFTCRLPDDSSIYTAELRAILLALKHVYYSKEKSFLILSDSLLSLQSILNLKYDHPVLVQI